MPALVAFAIPLNVQALEIRLPGISDPIPVSLPENHDPAKSWPAVFTYHGFNGRPTTRATRAHTGPRDWIVVGMAYAQRGEYELTPEGLAKEIKVFREVRDQLEQEQGLDPTRVVATGFSKGGWMTDALLQAEPSLSGGVILMGGHVPSSLENPATIAKDTPVFIGVGRRDPNYLPSLKAMVFYRGEGARTTFESWPELGHDFPREGSLSLREWFTLRTGGKPDNAALEKEFNELNRLEPIESWHALNRFKERPFANTPGSPWPDRIDAAITKLEKTPGVAREAGILKAHRNLLGRELKMRTLDELRTINGGYMKLLGQSKGSPQHDEIRLDHRRILAVLKQAESTPIPQPKPQRPALNPKPPSDGRTIPANPLVR